MNGLYLIPKFREQIENLNGTFFRIEADEKEPKIESGDGYTKTRYYFRINGTKAHLNEKRGSTYWLEYRGPIPNRRNPKTLTLFSRTLKAYKMSEGDWFRRDKHDHIEFP